MSKLSKIKFLKEIEIRDICFDNLNDVTSLITEEYGDKYPEQEFYQRDVIKTFIKRSLNKEGVYWKCAFYQGRLIGQIICEIKHNTAFLRLATVCQKYRRMGVMKLLSYYIERVAHLHNESDFKCVYAFISNENYQMQKHIVRYNYVRLGITPPWNSCNYFHIFGIIVYDYKWRLCTPHPKLYMDIFNTVKSGNINRFISINPSSMNDPPLKQVELNEVELKRLKSEFPQKIGVFSTNHELLAELSENKFQKSWYDLFYKKDLSIQIKERIVKKILREFNSNENVYSLSLVVDINDQKQQAMLLNSKLSYMAYLPFYLNGKDVILMGKSKFKIKRKKN